MLELEKHCKDFKTKPLVDGKYLLTPLGEEAEKCLEQISAAGLLGDNKALKLTRVKSQKTFIAVRKGVPQYVSEVDFVRMFPTVTIAQRFTKWDSEKKQAVSMNTVKIWGKGGMPAQLYLGTPGPHSL